MVKAKTKLLIHNHNKCYGNGALKLDKLQFDYSNLITSLIQKNIEKVFRSIYKTGEVKYKELIIDTGRAFENYLNSAVNKYSKVKSLVYKHQPVDLYTFYVDINVKCGRDVINTKKVENLLEYSKNVTIFGTGGIGKSTLFKHLFLNTIRTTHLIPIFLELKDINKKDINAKEYKFEDYIYESLIDLNFSLEKELFIKSLHSGNYIIFFDAFDELELDKKRFVHNEIERLTNKYGSNYYLVSSRPNEMLERGWNNFCDFTVQPLDKKKAIQLISNLNYEKEVKDKFLFQLKEENLFSTHSSFCSNPLLLTLMLLTFKEFAEIPAKLHLFYQEAFDVLYAKHDATKGVFIREKLLAKNGLALDDFKRIFSIFSAFSYQDSKEDFKSNELMEYIMEAKEEAKEDLDVEFNSNDFKIDLTEAVCILIQDGIDYTYQHRSFQEYFTALYIYNLGDERRQKFLMYLLEDKPTSIMNDNVFNMLFDMGRSKLERDFLIPALKEMKSLINDPRKEIVAYNFLNLITDYVYLKIHTQFKEGQKNYNFHGMLKLKKDYSGNNIRYKYLVEFVQHKYVYELGPLPGNFPSPLDTSERANKFKELYERRAGKEAYKFNSKQTYFNFIVSKDEPTKDDLDDLLFVGSKMVENLTNALLVLEDLEEKYAKQKTRRSRPKLK